jgi:hypothetical protein
MSVVKPALQGKCDVIGRSSRRLTRQDRHLRGRHGAYDRTAGFIGSVRSPKPLGKRRASDSLMPLKMDWNLEGSGEWHVSKGRDEPRPCR